MKQNIKKLVLALCMAVCFFSLTACADKTDAAEEPISEVIEMTMKNGAVNYLKLFDSYDEEALQSDLKRVQKMQDTVMESALTSWQSSRGDLGKMVDILSDEVVRLDEDVYQATVHASFEKRELVFSLTAEEIMNETGTTLQPTEILFTPVYTTGEKLAKAGMNTLMGMGTVFIVLIFISLIIASMKNVNKIEENFRKKKAEKEAAAAPAAPAPAPVRPAPAPAPVPVRPAPAPAPAPVRPAPAPAPAPVRPAPAPVRPAPVREEENLVNDSELVAVITAAIMAATPVEGLVVRSIRRKPGQNWRR